MIDKCKICDEFIDDFLEATTCWHCKVSVHNSCGKISKQLSRTVRVHENCKWVCDVCLSKPINDILLDRLNRIMQSDSSPFKDLPEILQRINHLSRNVQLLNDKYDTELNSSIIFPGAKRSRNGFPIPDADESLNLGSIGFDMSFNTDGSMFQPDHWENNYRDQQEATQQILQNQETVSHQSDKTDHNQVVTLTPVVHANETHSLKPQLIPKTILSPKINSNPPSNQLSQSQSLLHPNTDDSVHQLQHQTFQPHQQQQQHILQLQPILQHHVQDHQQQQKLIDRRQIVQKIAQIENANHNQQQHMLRQEEIYQQQIQFHQQQNPHYQSQSFSETNDCPIQAAHRLKHKFLYVSELQPTTTCEQMTEYISMKLNVAKSDIICKILLKKDCIFEDLEFVSFKIGIKENLFDRTKETNFWPPMVTARDFQDRRRSKPRQL